MNAVVIAGGALTDIPTPVDDFLEGFGEIEPGCSPTGQTHSQPDPPGGKGVLRFMGHQIVNVGFSIIKERREGEPPGTGGEKLPLILQGK